jgi:hypothetical protein
MPNALAALRSSTTVAVPVSSKAASWLLLPTPRPATSGLPSASRRTLMATHGCPVAKGCVPSISVANATGTVGPSSAPIAVAR